jgi:predicted acylesterase/phospholipase RssA
MSLHVPNWTTLAVVLLVGGCASPRPYPPPRLSATAHLIEIAAAPPGEAPIRQVAAWGDGAATRRPPRNILVLSGGGMHGAYTAGVLKGWTASGRRPRFDVVTGVSTGALIAPFAFLGPDHDAVLERGYTTPSPGDLYMMRGPSALLWADALADSTPLRRRVEAQITPDIVNRVGRAYAEGRRLYVGTTNLDTKSLVVWDLTAIAAGNDPRKVELFRDVILASCAIPGLLPPVPITIEVDGRRHSELHVDGGVSASLFLPSSVLAVEKSSTADPTVYVIVASKVKPDSHPVDRSFVRVSSESLCAVLQARFEGDLLRVYIHARDAGANFRLAAIPQDLPLDSNWMALDQAALRRLFDAGYQFAAGGSAWGTSPPVLGPGDQPPRTGVRFTVTE